MTATTKHVDYQDFIRNDVHVDAEVTNRNTVFNSDDSEFEPQENFRTPRRTRQSARTRKNQDLELSSESEDDDIEMELLREQKLLLEKQVAKNEQKADKFKLKQEVETLKTRLKSSSLNDKKPNASTKSSVIIKDLRKMRELNSRVNRNYDGLLESDSEVAPVTQGRQRISLKSGRDKKLIDLVASPQAWPQCYLELQYVSKGKTYDELSQSEFGAGYIGILETLHPLSVEYQARIAHYKTLMYYSTMYSWKAVLDLHGAVLHDIERGNRKWGDNFSQLEVMMLHHAAPRTHQSRRESSPSNDSTQTKRRTLFCKDYQTGKCEFTEDEHIGLVRDARRLVKHVCASCLLNDAVERNHPSMDSTCPHQTN